MTIWWKYYSLEAEAKDLRKRLLFTTSETTGRNLDASIKPGGLGSSIASIYQKTVTSVRSIEVRDVIRETLNIINLKYKRIYLFLDESDFFDTTDADALVHLCRRIKELLPIDSVIVLANRNLEGEFSNAYHDSQSLVRSTFRYYHNLNALWLPGKADLPKLLNKRMSLGKPKKKYQFPFAEDACEILDVLSGGNHKLLLQYVETSLIEGAIQEKQIPFDGVFIKEVLITHFEETKIHSEDEKAILAYLRSKPSHVSDKQFMNIIGSRTSLQEVLKNMEKIGLVKRNTKKTGVKQIYSITEKGQLLLTV